MPKSVNVSRVSNGPGFKTRVDDYLVVCHNARLVRERSHRLHQDCMKTIGASQNIRERSQLLLEQNQEIIRGLK